MTPLPPTVTHVRPPQWLSGSRVALALACPLSAALSAEDRSLALPTHPRALYGTVLHQLLEDAVRGRIDDSEGFPRGARKCLASLVGELPDCSPPPQLVFGLLRWDEKVADAIADAGALAQPYRSPTPAPGEGAAVPETEHVNEFALHTAGRWSEARLESAALRIRGRADLVERDGHTVVVTDLKTGHATGPGGAVDPAVVLQLRAYGLIVAERLPDADVRLRVASGASTDVSFGHAERLATARALAGLADALDPAHVVEASTLAAPSAACVRCSHRHRCPAYRDAAPAWWTALPDHAVPVDVWGTVTAMSSGAVTLDDVAGRRVQIKRLRPSFAWAAVGERVYAFGLDEPPGRWRAGRTEAPRTFQDGDADSARQAWALAVYSAPSRAA